LRASEEEVEAEEEVEVEETEEERRPCRARDDSPDSLAIYMRQIAESIGAGWDSTITYPALLV
jgi:hypothetical protein